MYRAKEGGAPGAVIPTTDARRRNSVTPQLGCLEFLIIDQSDFMQQSIATALRAIGADRLRETNDMNEAYDLLLAKPIDIILSDLGPEFDTLGLLHRVRTDVSSPNPAVPFILISANPAPHQVRQARDWGATDFLAKPCARPKLYERIRAAVLRQDEFVRCEAYVGPDRRRRANPFCGRDRRNGPSDLAPNDEWSILN